jgi:hypothetical protein
MNLLETQNFVEVKASSQVSSKDLVGLQLLSDELGALFKASG